MPEEQLRDKTLKGTAWTFVEAVSKYGITFIVSIVLARILSPEEYGLIGLLTIFLNILNVIVDGGFSNAIIQKKDVRETDYCTVFYINIAASLVMCLLLFVCAKPISSFFNQPLLAKMTRVMSLIIIINAFAIVPRAKLTKEINFKSQTIVTVISSFLSGAIGIIMALTGCGVWALVWQQISCQFFITISLWLFVRWKPQLTFSITSFKNLWSYGWKLIASNLINSIWQQTYEVIIGKCYSSYSLGLYSRASQFSSIIPNNVASIIQRVSFPVLSTIQDETEKLRLAYKRITGLTMYVTFVLMFGLCACSKSFIYVLVGEKWMESVPMMQLLCLQMMFIPLHGINSIAIQVVGRSDITLKVNICKCIINTLPIAVGILTNIYFMLASSIFTSLICFVISAYFSSRLICYRIIDQIRDIFKSFVISIIMGIVVYAISFFNIASNLYVELLLQVVVGGILLIILSKILKSQEYEEIVSFLGHKLKRSHNYEG